MNPREQSDLPPGQSYPSPNGAQMAQGAMPYYNNRQMTADDILTAELSRENSGPGLDSSNGVHHGQGMVLGSSNAGDMGRTASDEQHQHMIQFTPSQQVGVDPNHDLSYGEQSARKRSKISRACDECRRKKIRCDASSESGIDTCSNCRRLTVQCQFSRVPMKRGPSKGYIKELAERLHTLESQMQPVQPDVPYQSINDVSLQRNYGDFTSPVAEPPSNRKRTYSAVFEGLPSLSQYSSRGTNAFDVMESTPDPYNPTITSGNAPKPGNIFWGPDIPAGLPLDLSRNDNEDMSLIVPNEKALQEYYDKVHPLFPILPHTYIATEKLLQQCNRELQEAFCYALYTITRADFSRVGGQFEKTGSFDAAVELVLSHARQPLMLNSTAANLVTLQALILFIIDCDSRGPDNFLLKDGAPKQTLVQAAIKLGYDLAKNQDQLRSLRASEFDVDSIANLTRRNWVSLIILARWYAVSVADATVLTGQEIGGREDERVVGQTTMGLAAYSGFLSEIVTMATIDHNVCQTNTGLGRMVGANMVASLERLSEIEDVFKVHDKVHELSENENLLFGSLQTQLYWTLRLLIKRHIYVYSPYEIIYCAKEVINELHRATEQLRRPTPFDLHSLALASMTLLEAAVLPEHSSECWESLLKVEEILDTRAKPLIELNMFATPGWDAKIRVFLEWRRAKSQESQIQEAVSSMNKSGSSQPVMGPNEQRSLQHLADLAVGAEGTVSTPPPDISAEGDASPHLAPQLTAGLGRVVVDFTMLTKEGYLNVFSGLIYRRR